jgi:hypothetical protein
MMYSGDKNRRGKGDGGTERNAGAHLSPFSPHPSPFIGSEIYPEL